jgi:hypothetical protein
MLTSCFPSLPHLHIPRHKHNAYSFTSIKLSGQVINIKLEQLSYCLLSFLHSVLRSWLTFFLSTPPPLFAWTFVESTQTHARTHTSHARPSTNQPFARDHQDGTRVPRQLWCFVAAAVTIYPGAVTRTLFPCCNNKMSCVDVNAGWQLSGGVLATKWTAVSVYWSEICEWGESV